MGNLSSFYDRSEFVARTLTSNKKKIEVDVLYKLELEIIDVLVLDTPAVITSTLSTSDGRVVTTLPTVVSVVDFSKFTYLFEFTVASADWDGEIPLILDMSITDHESYVYKLEYLIKG